MSNKMALLIGGLLLLIIFLLWRLFGHNQILSQYHSVKQQLALQHTKNAEQVTRNEQLLNQVTKLQSNAKSLEAEARQSLGMIKHDEVFYQITSNHKKKVE